MTSIIRIFVPTIFGLSFLGIGKSPAALIPEESDAFNGKSAPAFSFQTIKGEQFSSQNFAGRPVLLNFFASWCPPCREEIGDLLKIYSKYKDRGLVIVGAATDARLIPETPPEQEKNDVAKLVTRLSIPYPVGIASDQMARDYSFRGIPTTIFIAADGKIAHVLYGYHNQQKVEEWVQRLITITATKPPGS
jgi:thiol-disulfide isomerase/thioredoxin